MYTFVDANMKLLPAHERFTSISWVTYTLGVRTVPYFLGIFLEL